ncbi:MAG: hypothetical protein K6F53_01190 [Lachnospiraceae bacterium]|nr:hypothetical protein [Lachnospiraceae bacterium]
MSNSSSKASLFLMELIMSILFFSLSAAVCVQLFVRSHTLSRDSLQLNYAVIASESMAETFYAADGDLAALKATLPDSYYNEARHTVNIYYDSSFRPININDFTYTGRYILSGTLSEDGDLKILTITYTDKKANKEIYSIAPALYPKGGAE